MGSDQQHRAVRLARWQDLPLVTLTCVRCFSFPWSSRVPGGWGWLLWLVVLPYLLFMLWLLGIQFPLVSTWLAGARRGGTGLLVVSGPGRPGPWRWAGSVTALLVGVGWWLLWLAVMPGPVVVWSGAAVVAGLAALTWQGRRGLPGLSQHARLKRRFAGDHPDHVEFVTLAAWPAGRGLGRLLLRSAAGQYRCPVIARANTAGLARWYRRCGAGLRGDGLSAVWAHGLVVPDRPGGAVRGQ